MVKSELLLVLGNQLFPPEYVYKTGARDVFMAEDYGLCTHFKYHKHKLILFLTAMRDYRDELDKRKVTVHYYDFNHELFRKDYEIKLRDYLDKSRTVDTITVYEVEDRFFEDRLKKFCNKHGLELNVLPSPMFYCSRAAFAEYLAGRRKPFMKTFYAQQRKRFSILVDDEQNPAGGRWSYDQDNRKKLPESQTVRKLDPASASNNLIAVSRFIDRAFTDHPGDIKQFWLPTDRKQSEAWMDAFLTDRLIHFGDYQDAISQRSDFVFHSVLSPMINMGLILPQDLVNKAIKYADNKRHDIPMNAIEGFVRQILGWREFIRGIYQNYPEQESKNFFKNYRGLQPCWYTAETGIPILDDVLNKSVKYAYNHHIERLMVISNMMLLCEIYPKEVHAWFMEMYADSSDWVMGPNVYGMGQFSDGGLFATKPYTCGSNYLLKMSDYSKGDWCDTVDGLYWRFISKHKRFYQQNQRMGMVVRSLDRMKADRKERIFNAAEAFIQKTTTEKSRLLN